MRGLRTPFHVAQEMGARVGRGEILQRPLPDDERKAAGGVILFARAVASSCFRIGFTPRFAIFAPDDHLKYPPSSRHRPLSCSPLGRPVAELAEELCISANPLYSWKSSSRPAARKRPPPPRKRHFQKSRTHPRQQNPAELRAMIESMHQQTGHCIRPVCQVLGVAPQLRSRL